MRDGVKETAADDEGETKKLASGLAFVELIDDAAALYTVRYLNNMQLSGTRGLIVDFCLEDARKMFHRAQKHEKMEKKHLKEKKDARTERRAVQRGETEVKSDLIVDLGKNTTE